MSPAQLPVPVILRFRDLRFVRTCLTPGNNCTNRSLDRRRGVKRVTEGEGATSNSGQTIILELKNCLHKGKNCRREQDEAISASNNLEGDTQAAN